jgi:hypothetical protein
MTCDKWGDETSRLGGQRHAAIRAPIKCKPDLGWLACVAIVSRHSVSTLSGRCNTSQMTALSVVCRLSVRQGGKLEIQQQLTKRNQCTLNVPGSTSRFRSYQMQQWHGENGYSSIGYKHVTYLLSAPQTEDRSKDHVS